MAWEVEASARENLSCLLKWLLEYLIASVFLNQLNTLVKEVERSKLEDIIGASLAALAVGEDPHARRIGTLLAKVREKRRGGGAVGLMAGKEGWRLGEEER